jgi:hypothetical protein
MRCGLLVRKPKALDYATNQELARVMEALSVYFLRCDGIKFRPMVDQEHDYFRPLCPRHYEVMFVSPSAPDLAAVPDTWFRRSRKLSLGASEAHDCECLVDGCPQHYSPGFGYFTIRRKDDHWNVTGSASIEITRSPTQVICGEHQCLMFLEAFHPKTKVESFRCPQKNCQQTVDILAGGPHAYWLGEGFFSAH